MDQFTYVFESIYKYNHISSSSYVFAVNTKDKFPNSVALHTYYALCIGADDAVHSIWPRYFWSFEPFETIRMRRIVNFYTFFFPSYIQNM